MKRKICVITGSRAEYGILKSIISKIKNNNKFLLQLVVTGMHLSPEFGLTYKEIEKDGYIINEKIEVLMSSDTSIGIGKSVGLGIIGFTEAFQRLKPDLILILGDRFEIFAAASAAMISRIPIAHLHGGELTEGVIDEAIRHSITKMSHLHFTSTEEYRKRVIQLGEQPEKVYNVGALGVENIKNIGLLNKERLEEIIKFKFKNRTAIVTFHPVTLEDRSSREQFRILLNAIDKFKDMNVIFTKANADIDGRIINAMIDEYTSENLDRCISFISMGQLNYLSALQYVDVVMGNSSSGIIEVPSFNIPTINVGDRQKGRIYGKSVINCDINELAIVESIKYSLSKKFKGEVKSYNNPYEKKHTSSEIMKCLEMYLLNNNSVKKKFYDIQ